MQIIYARGCQISLKRKPKTTKHDSQNIIQQWWQKHETQLPLLAKCTLRWHCVLTLSSSSERAFSAGGNIFSFKRTMLQPEKIDKLLYIQQNYGKFNVQRWKLVSSNKGDQSVPSIGESAVTEPHLATPTPETSYS